MIPRIRGRVGQVPDDEPHVEYRGKWSFEIHVSLMGWGDDKQVFNGPFYDSEKEAMKNMKEACRIACEAFEKGVDGKASGKYIDLKTNLLRNWEEN